MSLISKTAGSLARCFLAIGICCSILVVPAAGAKHATTINVPKFGADPGTKTPMVLADATSAAYDAAKARKDKAFENYTRLVTEGGSGSVAEALAEYKAAYEAFTALQAQYAANKANTFPAVEESSPVASNETSCDELFAINPNWCVMPPMNSDAQPGKWEKDRDRCCKTPSSAKSVELSCAELIGRSPRMCEISEQTASYMPWHKDYERCCNNDTFSPDNENVSDGQSVPWKLVIGLGLIAGLAVAAAAIRTIASRSKTLISDAKKARDLSKSKPPTGYILQVSADLIEMQPDHPVSLQVTVWQVNEGQGYQLAPDATIDIVVPAEAGFLSVTPTTGNGQLQVELSLIQPPASGEVLLQVNAATKDGGKSATVRVLCESQFAAYVNGAKRAPVRYDSTSKSWYFCDVIAGFWADGGTRPVKPNFGHGFATPPFVAVPDILALDDAYSDEQGRTIFKFSLKPGINLEKVFGQDLRTDAGQIRVKILPADTTGLSGSNEVIFQITPELVPLAWCCDAAPEGRARMYRDAKLDEFDIVADGKDELRIALIFVRSDKIKDGGDPRRYLDSAVDGIRIDKIELIGEGSQQFTSQVNLSATKPHELIVKSKSLILLTPATDHFRPALIVEGSLTDPQPGQLSSGVAFRANLNVLPVFMKLLVLPGRRPGTSLAVFYTGAVLANGEPVPLSGTRARIETTAYGSPLLAVDDPTDAATDKHGITKWTLHYHDMNWQNKAEARFKVRVGITEPDDQPCQATACMINVDANGADYLNAFDQAAPSLRLSNPVIRNFPVKPEFVYGVINNVNDLISRKNSRFGEYTCGALRDKIWRWTFKRRHDYAGDVATRMNGLDFAQYQLKPIHVFLSLFHRSMVATEVRLKSRHTDLDGRTGEYGRNLCVDSAGTCRTHLREWSHRWRAGHHHAGSHGHGPEDVCCWTGRWRTRTRSLRRWLSSQ